MAKPTASLLTLSGIKTEPKEIKIEQTCGSFTCYNLERWDILPGIAEDLNERGNKW